MRWPFVTRKRYELLEHNFAVLRDTNHRLAENVATEQGRAEKAEVAAVSWESSARQWGNLNDELRAMYATLMEKYHALRMDGGNQPWDAPTVESFGPLTKAALQDMSQGQSGMVKRKMRSVTESLWAQHANEAERDTIVAMLVRAGEMVTQ